jgi:hypothetical protein
MRSIQAAVSQSRGAGALAGLPAVDGEEVEGAAVAGEAEGGAGVGAVDVFAAVLVLVADVDAVDDDGVVAGDGGVGGGRVAGGPVGGNDRGLVGGVEDHRGGVIGIDLVGHDGSFADEEAADVHRGAGGGGSTRSGRIR